MGRRYLNLALQGGGAHGAFTWGVLDRLLEEPWIAIEGISGSSAGAMNALMMAHGWRQGGAAGARTALADFWTRIAAHSPARWLGPHQYHLGDHASFGLHDLLSRLAGMASPQWMNPLDINPLRDVLNELVDFESLRRTPPFRLFIPATEVRTGKLRLFRETELDAERLLASACLPNIHQPIEIDGEPYWDGGFSGNPVVYPLMFDCRTPDILIVLIQPLFRGRLPKDPQGIADRVAEIGFNNTFLREMRAIGYARQRLKGRLLLGRTERRLKKLRFHMIESPEQLAAMPKSSKYDTRRGFLLRLKELGRVACDEWLSAQGGTVGRRGSLDIVPAFC